MDMKEKLTFSLRTKNLSESSVRPLPHEAKKWEESFMELLSSKYGIALFRIFLSREFSEENLEFWLACEKYKKSKPQKLKNKAKKIYENYIAFQAPNEVNLDTATRETTINNLSNPDYNSLDHAQRRVQGLMENDAYIRFLKSEMFLELSQQTSPTAENPDKTS
ncbi:RGS3 (predicted) [Pycnogonum litorale]